MIHFNCPLCGHPIRVRDEAAGKKGTCNSCGEKITIPSESEQSETPSSRRVPSSNTVKAATGSVVPFLFILILFVGLLCVIFFSVIEITRDDKQVVNPDFNPVAKQYFQVIRTPLVEIDRFDDPLHVTWVFKVEFPIADGVDLSASFHLDENLDADRDYKKAIWNYKPKRSMQFLHFIVETPEYVSPIVKLLLDGSRMQLRVWKFGENKRLDLDFAIIQCVLSEEELQRLLSAKVVECKVGDQEFQFSEKLLELLREFWKEPKEYRDLQTVHDADTIRKKWFDDYLKEQK